MSTNPLEHSKFSTMSSAFMPSKALMALLGLAALSSARKCQNITVEVPVDSRNAVFSLKAPASNIEVTNFILNMTQHGHNLTAEVLTGVSESLVILVGPLKSLGDICTRQTHR